MAHPHEFGSRLPQVISLAFPQAFPKVKRVVKDAIVIKPTVAISHRLR